MTSIAWQTALTGCLPLGSGKSVDPRKQQAKSQLGRIAGQFGDSLRGGTTLGEALIGFRGGDGSVTQPFTADTPTAVLVRQLLGAISQFERATLVEAQDGPRPAQRRGGLPDRGPARARQGDARLGQAGTLPRTAQPARRLQAFAPRYRSRAGTARLPDCHQAAIRPGTGEAAAGGEIHFRSWRPDTWLLTNHKRRRRVAPTATAAVPDTSATIIADRTGDGRLISDVLSADCSGPSATDDGCEALKHVHQRVPSVAAGVNDGVVAVPNAVT